MSETNVTDEQWEDSLHVDPAPVAESEAEYVGGEFAETTVEAQPEKTDAPADAEAPAEPTTEGKKARGDRTPLEADLLTVVNQIVSGAVQLPEGSRMTPHLLAGEIAKLRGAPANSTSGGAVAARLDAWKEIGFCTLTEKPVAFEAYTATGQNDGLAACKEAYRARKSAERAAAKGTPAVAETPAPAPVDTESPVPAEVVNADPEVVSVTEGQPIPRTE